MSLVLNTNIDSLLAQNSLTTSGSQLQSALQQLSTGLRINTAADDAAGYAIVQGMTSQINGMNQAVQNANDGVSLVQTASGALSEITNDLQSMRNLAVESLNATNSGTDRSDLNTQFQQLTQDIDSVAANTQFNGVNLLDGTFQNADLPDRCQRRPEHHGRSDREHAHQRAGRLHGDRHRSHDCRADLWRSDDHRRCHDL